jgi:hypothetical protein
MNMAAVCGMGALAIRTVTALPSNQVTRRGVTNVG